MFHSFLHFSLECFTPFAISFPKCFICFAIFLQDVSFVLPFFSGMFHLFGHFFPEYFICFAIFFQMFHLFRRFPQERFTPFSIFPKMFHLFCHSLSGTDVFKSDYITTLLPLLSPSGI